MDKFKRLLINTAITEFACEVIWIYSFLLLGTLRWLAGLIGCRLLLSNKSFGFSSHLLNLVAFRKGRGWVELGRILHVSGILGIFGILAYLFVILILCIFAFVLNITYNLLSCKVSNLFMRQLAPIFAFLLPWTCWIWLLLTWCRFILICILLLISISIIPWAVIGWRITLVHLITMFAVLVCTRLLQLLLLLLLRLGIAGIRNLGACVIIALGNLLNVVFIAASLVWRCLGSLLLLLHRACLWRWQEPVLSHLLLDLLVSLPLFFLELLLFFWVKHVEIEDFLLHIVIFNLV